MFTVEDILPAVERALGTCNQAELIEAINAAVEILCAESDWDPARGFVDLTVDADRHLTLPDEVETILAINIGGRPSQGHDMWFQFHLNGPGSGRYSGSGLPQSEDCLQSCEFDWFDRGQFPTITDPNPSTPFAVSVALNAADQANSAVFLRVFGYDLNGNWITTVESGVTVDGFLVPKDGTVNGAAPLLTRITRVQKAQTLYPVQLYVNVASAATTLLGNYRAYETNPQYRRVRLSRGCTWARVAYKKRLFNLVRTSDLIPLHSPRAVVLMAQALKKFDQDRLKEGQEYWQTAVALLLKKQLSLSPPTGPSIQIANRNLIADKCDRLE